MPFKVMAQNYPQGRHILWFACHDLNKPFYVVCDTLKFLKQKPNEHVLIEIKPPTKWLNPPN